MRTSPQRKAAIRKAVEQLRLESTKPANNKPTWINIEGRDYLRTDLFKGGVSCALGDCVLYHGTWYAPALMVIGE